MASKKVLSKILDKKLINNDVHIIGMILSYLDKCAICKDYGNIRPYVITFKDYGIYIKDGKYPRHMMLCPYCFRVKVVGEIQYLH